MMSRSSMWLFSTKRYFSLMGRDSADMTSQILKRITPKHQRKPLGSYPFPPEEEMLWLNRRPSPGGYFQHSISPFQLKFMYPVLHMAPARIWTKLNQNFWWVVWPTLMTVFACYSLVKLDRMNRKRNNYY